MHGEVVIGRVEIRIVAVRFAHARLGVVRVLWRAALCGRGAQNTPWSRWSVWFVEHNTHSESSHFKRSGSLLHPAAGRHSSEESTGGRQAVTAACLVRNVISA